MMEFRQTGRLPAMSGRPQPSPLAALLMSLPPRNLTQIRNLVVGPDLGYRGSRRFSNAQQALNWLYPLNGEITADSWRDRRFEVSRKELSLELLCKHCDMPKHLQ